MDRPDLSITLALLFPWRHFFGSTLTPECGTFAISRHSLGSHHDSQPGTFLLSRAFPWIRMFSAYVPFYCIGEASWVAFFSGGKRCWEVCYIYHYRFAPSSIQHGAMDFFTASDLSIYQFESGGLFDGSGPAVRACLCARARCSYSLIFISTARFLAQDIYLFPLSTPSTCACSSVTLHTYFQSLVQMKT